MRARKILARSRIEIGGSLSTQSGAKSAEIVLSRKSHAHGPLVGGLVEIRSRARAEDVYGTDVRVGDGAEVERIIAETTHIGPGARVGEVVYSREATIDPSAQLARPARRVSDLGLYPL